MFVERIESFKTFRGKKLSKLLLLIKFYDLNSSSCRT